MEALVCNSDQVRKMREMAEKLFPEQKPIAFFGGMMVLRSGAKSPNPMPWTEFVMFHLGPKIDELKPYGGVGIVYEYSKLGLHPADYLYKIFSLIK